METRVEKIEKHKTALTLALMAAVIAFILLILGLVAFLFGFNINITHYPLFEFHYSSGPESMVLLIVSPIMEFVLTYIVTYVACAAYNFSAAFTGGIVFYQKIRR